MHGREMGDQLVKDRACFLNCCIIFCDKIVLCKMYMHVLEPLYQNTLTAYLILNLIIRVILTVD